jgi:hypothetical protein
VPQRLNSYFAASRELRGLAHQAQQLIVLQRQYRQLAPQSLAHASQVIGFERHILILGADNSAIAAKLRQLAPQFVHLFQESGAKVTGILVKVQVATTATKRASPRHSLGAAGRQQIATLAAGLPDSPLKIALQRLLAREQ